MICGPDLRMKERWRRDGEEMEETNGQMTKEGDIEERR